MTTSHAQSWPTAHLDGVGSVELLALATGGHRVVARVIAAPVDVVWDWLADLEVSIPAFDRTVKSVKILERTDNVLTMSVRSRFLPAMRFTCHLGEHHWMMVAPGRLYCVAGGVRALGPGQTMYAQFEAIPRRVGHLTRRLVAHHVQHDVDTVVHVLEQFPGSWSPTQGSR